MSSRRRPVDTTRAWTPVDQLSELARALLSEDLGGREAVPAHVADRVNSLAAQWAERGFTADTVRPWVELTPECAAYLVDRGVPARALDRLIDFGGSTGLLTVRTALSTDRLTAAQAYEALAAAGGVQSSAPTPAKSVGQAADPPDAEKPDEEKTSPERGAPAPLTFSHAEADRQGDSGHGKPRTTGQPSRTPFHR